MSRVDPHLPLPTLVDFYRGRRSLLASGAARGLRHGPQLDQADSQSSDSASEQPQQHQCGHALKKCIFLLRYFRHFCVLHSNLLLIILAFALPLPDPRGGRKRLRQQEMAVEATLARTIVQSFSPKGKLSEQQGHEFLVSWQKPPASTKAPGHPMIATL